MANKWAARGRKFCSMKYLSILFSVAVAALPWSARADDRAGDEKPLVLDPLEVRDAQLPVKTDRTVFKLPMSLHETPRSVTVIEADRIREQNFQTLENTFRYVPGIFSYGANEDSYRFYARGFNMGPDETKVDGFPGGIVDKTFSGSLFGIERIVYLRGPAGLQYGAAAAPGGVINLITKRPLERAATKLDLRYASYVAPGLTFGTHRSLEAELDSTGPLTTDGRVLYRLLLDVENAGFYNDGIDDHNRAGQISVTWKMDPEGRFTFTPLYRYQDLYFAWGRTLAISPSTSLATNDGATGPVHTGDLSPLHVNLGGGGRPMLQRMAGADWKAAFTPSWQATVSYRYFATDRDNDEFVPQAATLTRTNPADPLSWVIARRQLVSQIDGRNQNLDVQTTFECEPAGGVKNLTQLGLNARWFRTVASRAAATQPNQSPINIYTGIPVTPLVDNHPVLIDSFLEDNFQWNAYVQNQTSLHEKWVVTLGLGYGQQSFDRTYPATLTPPANLAALLSTRKGRVVPNAGVVYHWTAALALYASFSSSYQPADRSLENMAGEIGTFEPTVGKNYEVGLKYDRIERDLSVSVSLFDTKLDRVLVQSGVAELNPRGNRYFVQTGGGRRARGVELSGEYVFQGTHLTGTFAYLDARYFGEGRIPGARMEKTPRYSASLWARRDFGAERKWSAGVGLIWQDVRWSAARTTAAPDPLVLPAYSRVDALVAYRFNRNWNLSLNVENLTNELYFVGGATGALLETGGPRLLTARMGWSY